MKGGEKSKSPALTTQYKAASRDLSFILIFKYTTDFSSYQLGLILINTRFSEDLE